MNNNIDFFVLGTPDHEMREIERVCQERGLAFGYATIGGRVVHSYEAHDADDVTCRIPLGARVVTVECSVMGLRADVAIDHHRPGDAGFGKPPERYLEGSSIGQFLRHIGLEPTQRQRVIAAADHCLSSAYQGLCPGVSLQELVDFREETRSRARNISREELRRQIQEASRFLRSAPSIELGGTQVAWIEDLAMPEVSEASAREGIPYMYTKRQHDGRKKAGIQSAPAHLVQTWLQECGLSVTYGDPARGFAGGYL